MSSFKNPHHFYLFAMRNGKRKLGYGSNPEQAYENLRLRLSPNEMESIIKDQYTSFPQRDLQKHARELG